MTSTHSGHFLRRVRGGLAMNAQQESTSTRSPVLAILASLVPEIARVLPLERAGSAGEGVMIDGRRDG